MNALCSEIILGRVWDVMGTYLGAIISLLVCLIVRKRMLCLALCLFQDDTGERQWRGIRKHRFLVLKL